MAIIDGWALCEIDIDGQAQLAQKVQVLTVIAISTTMVRITFDRPMLKDSYLLDKNNYSLTPQSNDDVEVVISSVYPKNVDEPNWVDLICSEHTDAKSYDLEILNDNIKDTTLMPVDLTQFPITYTSIGLAPVIIGIKPTSKNTIEIKFSETMLDNATIRDPLRYSFSGGLTVVEVMNVVDDTVTLITSDQTENTLYTLTITQP